MTSLVRFFGTVRGLFRGQAWLLVLALSPTPAGAVILFGTGDLEANTSEPGGALAGSGWEHQGRWGAFAGTPIGEHHFITAGHVGGALGDRFSFQGGEFTAAEPYDDPDSDLRIWRVCEAFPTFAQLYEDTNELGRPLVVFGRGTQRGEPVLTTGGLRGWKWGGGDGRLRWGQNQVSELADASDLDLGLPGVGRNNLLKATFDSDAGPNEAHLSVGDSGGAVFIQDASGVWKLAGINVAVVALYNTSTNGPGFLAALFDARGLYEGEENDWTLIGNAGLPHPGAFYATRISSSLAWIKSVLSLEISERPVLQIAPAVTGPFVDDMTAVQSDSNTIVVSRPPGTRFYRLRGCAAPRILSITIQGETVWVRYSSG